MLFTVKPLNFDRQMAYLYKHRYNVISLADLIGRLRKREALPDRTVCLTFDDGFADNYFNVLPVLKKYNFPATIFLLTGYMGKELDNSQKFPIAIMSEAQAKEMANSGLIEFGSHTDTHSRLEAISNEDFTKELETSRIKIERITGNEWRFFAYPRGFFRKDIIGILKSRNIEAALTVQEGLIGKDDDVFLLKRNFINRETGLAQFYAKISPVIDWYVRLKLIFSANKDAFKNISD